MGFHATIAAGEDQFGNDRHRTAPRVRASERVTGTSQVRKFHELAGDVTAFPGISGVTHDEVSQVAVRLQLMLASRRVTRLTETVTDYRKVSGTRFELPLRAIGGKVTVRKVTTRAFTGWIAVYTGPGSDAGIPLAAVSKGASINHHGERQDCCAAALNTLTMALRAA